MKRLIFLSIVVLLTVNCFSQKDMKTTVQTFFASNDYNGARLYIDSCIKTPDYANNEKAWYYRAFTYKKLYTEQENANKESPSRIIALESFRRANELDTSRSNREDNKKNINYLAITLYNDAAASIDSINYNTGIKDFELYKKYKALVDNSKDEIKESEIKYKLALGVVYYNLYTKQSVHDIRYYDLASTQFLDVLKLGKSDTATANLKRLKSTKKIIDKAAKDKKIKKIEI